MPKPPEKTGLAIVLLLACALSWGSNVVVGRAVHEELPPIGLAFWRNAAAFAMVLPFTAKGLITQWHTIRECWVVMFAAGVIGTAVFNAMTYWALQDTTAVNGSIMMSLTPVVIPVFAVMILRIGLTGRQAAGIAVSFVGVVAILTGGDLSVLTEFAFRRGDLWMLGGMVCWALYSVVVKLRPAELDPYVFLSVLLAVAMVVLLPFYVWESGSGFTYPATWQAAGIAIYLGLFPTALALLFFNMAVDIVGPNRAGLCNHLVPVFATILAVLFLGEHLALFHLVGVAFIAAGLYLATAQGSARRG